MVTVLRAKYVPVGQEENCTHHGERWERRSTCDSRHGKKSILAKSSLPAFPPAPQGHRCGAQTSCSFSVWGHHMEQDHPTNRERAGLGWCSPQTLTQLLLSHAAHYSVSSSHRHAVSRDLLHGTQMWKKIMKIHVTSVSGRKPSNSSILKMG